MSARAMESSSTPHSSEHTDTWLAAGDSPDHRRDGADGKRRSERRRKTRSADSPTDILKRMPAVMVLDRITIPSLAMTRDGIILFANTAFAEMVGYRQNVLKGLAFPAIFHTVPAAVCGPAGIGALTNLIVELQHCAGWTVRARMSESAMMRYDDPVVLVTFEDLTERLWTATDGEPAAAGSRKSQRDSTLVILAGAKRGRGGARPTS